MFKTIVVGAHSSPTAQLAAAEARQLAEALDAHVHFVYAYKDDGGPVDGKDTPARIAAERVMESMLPAGGRHRFTTHALPGDATAALLQVAKETNADLIVVGNKGMKGARRVLGSVPNDVAHRAECAVLIVNTT